MKKLITIGAFLLCSHLVFAQLKPGTWLTGGAFSISMDNRQATENQSTSSSFGLLINPFGGRMISKKVAVALSISYSYSEQESRASFGITEVIFGFDRQTIIFRPSIRFYQPVIAKRIGFLFQAGIGFGQQAEENFNRQNGNTLIVSMADNFIFDISLFPGVFFLVTPKISLEATFGAFFYEYQEQTIELIDLGTGSELQNSRWNLAASDQITLGITYFFGRP